MLTLRRRVLIGALISALTAGLLAMTPAQAAVPKCFGKKATLFGTAKANRLTGTPGNDVIAGLGGNDIVHGLGGADLICGGGGRDFLFGEEGNDRIDLSGGGPEVAYGGAGDDLIRGKAAEDDASSYATSPAAITADLRALQVTGDGTDTLLGISHIEGSPSNDTITGDDSGNWLFGLGGADTLDGEGGNDELYGFGNPTREDASDGADVATGDAGNDFLTGGVGNDNLNGGADVDFVEGGSNDDTLVGGGQQFDSVDYRNAPQPVTVNLQAGIGTGGDGNDTVNGFTDIYGSPHPDTLIATLLPNEGISGGGGDDQIDGGDGVNDAVIHSLDNSSVTVDLTAATASSSTSGNDSLTGIESAYGSRFGDTLTGSPTQNELYGLNGADTLFGRLGDDLLDGGAGFDTLTGEEGTDTCLQGESLASCESTVPPTGRRARYSPAGRASLR